jgi:hypothetical protein
MVTVTVKLVQFSAYAAIGVARGTVTGANIPRARQSFAALLRNISKSPCGVVVVDWTGCLVHLSIH